jgi:hypothetical protein
VEDAVAAVDEDDADLILRDVLVVFCSETMTA